MVVAWPPTTNLQLKNRNTLPDGENGSIQLDGTDGRVIMRVNRALGSVAANQVEASSKCLYFIPDHGTID